MRILKKLNIEESVKRKKLIYTENWFDKIDRLVIYFVFTWGFVLPFLIYFDPQIDYTTKGIEYYLIFIFSLCCAYVIYRKATEKKLTEIESQFDLEDNRKLINEYCEKNGFEKYLNSKNIIVYNSESLFNMYPGYKTSRIFLLHNQSIYLTMIRDTYRFNIPVLFSQILLKKDIEKIMRK